MRPVIVNWFTYSWEGADQIRNNVGEIFTQPSLTVPDQALSIRDLVARFTRGQDVRTYEGQYTHDRSIPDNLERMTEMDRLDLSRQLKDGIESVQRNHRSRKPIIDIIDGGKAPTEVPDNPPTPDKEAGIM